ncbi:arylamine N-acetyltransferase family protein [Phascolarctobacterium succinatutens]|uniref:arylamine N-acetyltransferase family protein n=1 Tax=Phascolarctobacterium succinatutens TaxID=626940 RepID=UPI0023F67D95|nr:arylamine N-acetyltransferase [Phascolarctobacterium succinatutens]
MIALPNYADINGRPMKKLQIEQYLRKLQLNDFEPAVNLTTLTKLQDAHLKYIPYENFDSLNGKITSLKRQDMFNKVIMHNRGGICFELNGLYNWLLESLGFDVTSYSARFIDKMETYQLRRHRVMCVALGEKRYLTDVGVNSESPRVPLEIVEGLIQSDGISQYKFTRSEFWGWLLWQKERGKIWKRLFGFTEEPQIDKDFITASFWCDAHPDSPFIKSKKLSIFREDCNITIRSNYLKFYLGGRVKYRYKINTGAELKEILWEYFGINVEYRLKDDGIEY